MVVRILSVLLIGLMLFGCKSKKKVVNKTYKPRTERVVIKKDTPKPIEETLPNSTDESKINELPSNASYAEILSAYIDTYSEIAMEEMLQYGIPASITLAQGILESGAGRGELTQKAHNHFGIKCHDWTGDRVYHDDDEKGECFRKYKDPKYSFRDHSLFLAERSRYQALFKLKKDDYKGWARGLKAAGYATDPKYPDKLIGIIEKNNLTRFDKQVLGGTASITQTSDEQIKTYTVQPGDTLYAIARKFNITVETLKEYNGLQSNLISVGQVLYLHSVKNR